MAVAVPERRGTHTHTHDSPFVFHVSISWFRRFPSASANRMSAPFAVQRVEISGGRRTSAVLFIPDMYFEDIATSGRVLYHANKIAITDKYLYYYVKRFGSIMSTMNAKQINDYMRSVLIVRNHVQEAGLYQDYRSSVRRMSRKMCILNVYSITRQHLLHLDFRKWIYNLRINHSAYKYVTSDKYISMDGIPDIPFKIHQPGWEKKKRDVK